jgi:hypothetical protein
LILFNSEFSSQVALRLADSVRAEVSDDRAGQIELLYRRTLGRRPSKEEAADVAAFLESRKPDKEAAEAFVDVCLAVLNASEFIYIE